MCTEICPVCENKYHTADACPYCELKHKVEFTSLRIDDFFYAHKIFWRKISPTAAKGIGAYGCCNFTKDAEDRYVWPVSYEYIDTCLQKHWPRSKK